MCIRRRRLFLIRIFDSDKINMCTDGHANSDERSVINKMTRLKASYPTQPSNRTNGLENIRSILRY